MSYILNVLPSWSDAHNFVEKLNVVCAYALMAFCITVMFYMIFRVLIDVAFVLSRSNFFLIISKETKEEKKMKEESIQLCNKLNLDYNEQLNRYNGNLPSLHKYLQTVEAWR